MHQDRDASSNATSIWQIESAHRLALISLGSWKGLQRHPDPSPGWYCNQEGACAGLCPAACIAACIHMVSTRQANRGFSALQLGREACLLLLQICMDIMCCTYGTQTS